MIFFLCKLGPLTNLTKMTLHNRILSIFFYGISLLILIGFVSAKFYKTIENVDQFSFPVITDTLSLNPITPNFRNTQSVINKIGYIGQNKDSIVFERWFVLGDHTNFWCQTFHSKNLNLWQSRVKIHLDLSQSIKKINSKNVYFGFPVIIENLEEDTIQLGINWDIAMVLEAQDINGFWKACEKPLKRGCVLGPKTIGIPPGNFVLTNAFAYEGDFETKLRIRIGDNYSNTYMGRINKAQMVE